MNATKRRRRAVARRASGGHAPLGTFAKVVAAVGTKDYRQCATHVYSGGDEDPDWIQSFFSIVQDEEVDERERRHALRALDDEHAQLHAEREARAREERPRLGLT